MYNNQKTAPTNLPHQTNITESNYKKPYNFDLTEPKNLSCNCLDQRTKHNGQNWQTKIINIPTNSKMLHSRTVTKWGQSTRNKSTTYTNAIQPNKHSTCNRTYKQSNITFANPTGSKPTTQTML